MPAVATRVDFIDVVRKSALVADGPLDAALDAAPANAEPAALAARLVHAGLVTPFQVKQLLAGKWKRFVLNEKYKLLDHLGTGGMGSVFLAEHVRLKRLVALKILPPDRLTDAAMVARFEREAQAIASFDHPNIVRCHDIDRDGTQHFLVMEFVDGVSLQHLVAKFGPLPPERVANYLAQTAMGLQAAHEAGWVHRDIKPGNILVDRTGVVKILDLGLARVFAEPNRNVTEQFAENCVLGTADYCSPEQANNSQDVDIRADIYSLGATGYFLLTGRVPFEGSTAQKLIGHQMHEPKAIKQLKPGLPDGLVAVVRKMMAKDLAKRYPVPAAVAEALAPWAGQPVPPPGPHELPSWPPLVAKMIGGGGATTTTSTPVLLARASSTASLMLPGSGRVVAGPKRGPGRALMAGGAGVLVAGVAAVAWVALSGSKPEPKSAVVPFQAVRADADQQAAFITPEQAIENRGKPCAVEYVVRSVGGNKRVKLYADAGESAGSFLCVIQKGSVPKFGGDVKQLKEKYLNRKLRVTGTVVEWFDDDEPDKKFSAILLEDPANLEDMGEVAP